jgi:hypothetical protein
MTRSMLATTVACLALLLSGCQSGDKAAARDTASMGALNDTCPVMGGAVDPEAETAAYHGYEIGFCCNGCKAKWDQMSESAKQAFVAKYTE